MPPKSNTVDDLIIALRDQRVLDALASVLESKLESLIQSITELKADNERKSLYISKLQSDLQSASSRIEALDSYTRRDNLLITGLPIETYAEATMTGAAGTETNQSVENSVLKLCTEKLGVNICSSDISVAHRLKKRQQADPRPPVTIVRFTNRKAREAVYAARRNLKNSPTPIYINEDLTKSTAELFHEARKLVKQKAIFNAWTTSCAVYIRDTGEPNCRPRKLSSIGELPHVQIA
jgi:hypothetical protein